VSEYLEIALGKERLRVLLRDMCCPPLSTCVRVNTQRCTVEEALGLLTSSLDHKQDRSKSEQPHVHPDLKNVLCIPGARRAMPEFNAAGMGGARRPFARACSQHPCRQRIGRASAGLKEVVVTRKAGEAVLRGAPVFAPGVLAISKHTAPGDSVAVSIAREVPGAHCVASRWQVLLCWRACLRRLPAQRRLLCLRRRARHLAVRHDHLHAALRRPPEA
jgi:hypothetical protein